MSDRIDVSIVIPTYNEEMRLPAFLNELSAFCGKSKRTFEVIVVDDGSSDKTSEVALSFRDRFKDIKVLRLKSNRGKGYTVQQGLLKSKGDICLFIDADGSIPPEEIEKNLHYVADGGFDIFVGSRVLTGPGQELKIKWYRKLMGAVFNLFVHALLFRDIRDTQCGFKMFRREVVEPLFSRSYLNGFGFDVEILYLAYKMGYKVKEGPISWKHVPGGKINLLAASITMLFNILQVRNWHCTPINPYSKYLGPNEYKFMYEMERDHWWFVSRNRLVIDLIRALKKKSPAILDVGSGTGGNLLEFSKIGKAYGIDISEKAVEFCRKRGLKNVALSPVEAIDHEDKTFDIITCIDLLEHVSKPGEALEELKRVLKDDGKIIVTVPAFRFLWSQHDEALCHLRRYRKHTLRRDVEEAGLKIEKMGYLFFVSFFVVAPIRILRKFLRRRGGTVSDTTTLPPGFLNGVLKFLFRIEEKIALSVGLPLGTTLYAVVSK